MYTEEMTAKVLGMTIEQYRAYKKSAAPKLAAKAMAASLAGNTSEAARLVMKRRKTIAAIAPSSSCC